MHFYWHTLYIQLGPSYNITLAVKGQGKRGIVAIHLAYYVHYKNKQTKQNKSKDRN